MCAIFSIKDVWLKHQESFSVIGSVFSLLFSHMSYDGMGYSDGTNIISNENMSGAWHVRKKAASMIAILSSKCSDIIIRGGMISLFYSAAQTEINKDTISNAQYTCMIEALVVICERMEDLDLKRSYMNDVLSATITWLLSADVQVMCSSPSSLLEFCYLAAERKFHNIIDDSIFSKTLHCFNMLSSCCKHITPMGPTKKVWIGGSNYALNDLERHCPFAGIVASIFPAIVQHMIALNKMWHITFKNEISQIHDSRKTIFATIFDVNMIEIGVITGKMFCGQDADNKKASIGENMRSVMNELRMTLAQLAGYCCHLGVLYGYFTSNKIAPITLLENIALFIPFLENRHVSHLIKAFIIPLVQNCPPFAVKDVDYFIGAIVSSLCSRLQVMLRLGDFIIDDIHQILPSEIEHQHFLYFHCAIDRKISEDVKNCDLCDIAKECIRIDLAKNICDLMAAGTFSKGLHTSGKDTADSDIPENEDANDYMRGLEYKRTAIQFFLFSTGLTNANISHDSICLDPWLRCILTILKIENSQLLFKALDVVRYMHTLMQQGESRLVFFITHDVFRTLLISLMMKKKWIEGNLYVETGIIVYEIYANHVVGLHSENAGMIHFHGGRSEAYQRYSYHPREALVSICNISLDVISIMEKQILQELSSRKRREIFLQTIASKVM